MSLLCRKDLGLLAVRLGVGGVLFAHGAQKLFGWFGGGGLESTATQMEGMGFRPGRRSAVLAGVGEAGGGTLLALGLATPVGGAMAAGAMATAAAVHAPAGFFLQTGGFEYPAVLGCAAAGLGIAGPGRCSFDHSMGNVFNRTWQLATAFTVTAAVTAAVINRRVVVHKWQPHEPEEAPAPPAT
ncbi:MULTISPECIES: DoxX family protein [Streptomycetaceae]|uniref:DoxX family protein n=1 Tax=Streptantibioticus cattleyicolor (strain ATCC 35852 / DSM 46488 / JCM 4925 / NBRC 14057 / NRRL 8057) TaxID=1003195 RepID=F8JX97_STREN|nr:MULTISPECIES: DoxX family membrane protein [Streptomycetaceae]AEW94562.1 hypothetical protein SCATT_21910 [Streptantibioticus cattleyicolor NRRL 8057 = DSM 46488]MYS59202.1 DoxX family membrane protein [Streptomyces sp. SID5468]CCB74921.1 putative membrane protein [Streptantibioticus cattleyicolor NRRL 8057 = DSM 46488]